VRRLSNAAPPTHPGLTDRGFYTREHSPPKYFPVSSGALQTPLRCIRSPPAKPGPWLKQTATAAVPSPTQKRQRGWGLYYPTALERVRFRFPEPSPFLPTLPPLADLSSILSCVALAKREARRATGEAVVNKYDGSALESRPQLPKPGTVAKAHGNRNSDFADA